jgi:hypothetical protein
VAIVQAGKTSRVWPVFLIGAEVDGLTGLADHSHRPRYQPRQLDAEIEALSSARSWRTAGGAIHASGSRPARSSCAKIAAPGLVVLQPRRGDRLALQRVHQVRVEAIVL